MQYGMFYMHPVQQTVHTHTCKTYRNCIDICLPADEPNEVRIMWDTKEIKNKILITKTVYFVGLCCDAFVHFNFISSQLKG